MTPTQYIIICGSPCDGFTFFGPFDEKDHEDAIEKATNLKLDWWITELEPL